MRTAADVVLEALGQRLLLDWITNRAQVHHPLSLNLRQMAPGEAEVVLRAAAAAVAAGGPATEARVGRAMAWVARAKGDEEHRRALREAIAAPPEVGALMEEVVAADLAGHAYAASLAATDQRDEVNRSYADYMAARLSIPAALARSLARRYRL